MGGRARPRTLSVLGRSGSIALARDRAAGRERLGVSAPNGVTIPPARRGTGRGLITPASAPAGSVSQPVPSLAAGRSGGSTRSGIAAISALGEIRVRQRPLPLPAEPFPAE